MTNRRFMFVPDLDLKGTNSTNSTEGTVVDEPYANVVSSLVGEGLHAPVLDIDFEARLVPSSTPGHYHLYLDRAMTWAKYKVLLEALADAEIIEPGYAAASIKREYSCVRKPGWMKKVAIPWDVAGAPESF